MLTHLLPMRADGTLCGHLRNAAGELVNVDALLENPLGVMVIQQGT